MAKSQRRIPQKYERPYGPKDEKQRGPRFAEPSMAILKAIFK
jgi:hypothetical protein